MLHDGVRLAREAVNELYIKEKRVAFVVATIGCYGASLADGSEYTGKYDLNEWELVDFHLKKLMTLAEAYPDWIAFETIPCLGECSAIMKLLKTKSALLKQKFPVWISFACCDDKHLNDGSLLSSALDRVFEEDPEAQIVNAVGVNCCSATNLLSLITIIAQHRICKLSSRGIVFYPNRGETWDAKNNCWKAGSGSDAEGLAKSITETIKYIDNDTAMYKSLIVGGCCRTEPCHIRQIRSEINEVAYE